MSTSVTTSLQCPRCGASLRAGSDWCSLCYADLRPAPSAPSAQAGLAEPSQPVPPSRPTAPTAPAAPATAAETAPRGKRRKSGPSEAEVEVLADQLVAQLAASQGGRPFGAASGLVDTPGKRAALMIGGGLLAMLVFFVLLAVLGALL